MFEARSVARGMEMLDRHFPTWFHVVQPGELNIQTYDNCVLGQIARDRYWHLYGAEARWVRLTREFGLGIRSTRRLGFWRMTRRGNERLKIEWQKAIALRRENEIVVRRHVAATAEVVERELMLV